MIDCNICKYEDKEGYCTKKLQTRRVVREEKCVRT